MLATQRSMLTGSVTDPYSAIDSFMYDLLFAPAVLQMARPLVSSIVDGAERGCRILDVGCGGAHTALELARARADLTIAGIDLCESQVRRAIRRARDLGERLAFQVGDAMSLPYATGEFGTVISVTAIKHWPSQSTGLRECLRVLRPGGELQVLEVDRGCHLDHARRIVELSRVPRWLHPIALPLLRTNILGRGIDLDQARALVRELPIEDASVERVPDMPAILIRGRAAA